LPEISDLQIVVFPANIDRVVDRNLESRQQRDPVMVVAELAMVPVLYAVRPIQLFMIAK
jgi:uncharacterized membrane protein